MTKTLQTSPFGTSFGDVHKILVVTPSNLGDAVLTLPVFQTLHRSFPNGRFHVIAGAGAAPIFEGDTRIGKVTVYDKKMPWVQKAKWIAAIRRERYDLIVDLKRSLVGLLGGARFRSRYFDLSRNTLHRSQRHLRLIGNLADISAQQGSFLNTDGLPSTFEKWGFPDGRPVVVAAPGSKSDVKKWPAESFAKLLDRLASHSDCRIVLVGDAQDAADAAKVGACCNTPPLDLTGKTNFRELVAVLKAASLLVTNDSAPLHIADALETPTLALFGPTDPKKYGPRFSGSLVARRVLFCSPCEKAQCRYHRECLRELTVDEVHKKSLEILNDAVHPRGLKILAIRLDRIGDVLLSLPAIEAIRERFPDAFLSVMTRPYTKDLVEGHPAVDEVIPYFYEKGGRHRSLLGYSRFLAEIIRRKFDIAFVLHPSARSILIPFLAGIPYRIGHDIGPVSFLLTKKIPDRRREGKKHESEYAMDVVRAFGIETPPIESGRGTARRAPTLSIFAEERARVEDFLGGVGAYRIPPGSDIRSVIALHPGASCPSKRWPKERFALLAKKILSETDYGIVVVGGEGEKALGEYLMCEAAHVGARRAVPQRDLTGRLNLKELAALLQQCKILVSNDSGPVHVAAAVGTPTLCVFGRNEAGLSPARWRALGEGHRTVQKDVGCVVCLAHRCTIGFECLNAVTVDEVFLNLQEMLDV